MKKRRKTLSFPNVFIGNLVLCVFLFTSVIGPIHAGEVVVPFMPTPGTMVRLSPQFTPAYLKGIVIHPEDPLKFDFIIHRGDKPLTEAQKREEYTKLTKYFLASLAIPDEDQWVNLSPYEKDRIIKDNFGKTAMGRDLLAQDYLLKQITASLIYPQDSLGKKFWDRVYKEAQEKYGTTNIPVNTFNKVWILPDDALIYEKGNTAYILKNHLRVMLEEDYLALTHNVIPAKAGIQRNGSPIKTFGDDKAHTIVSKIVKEIILPALEREVNEGRNFAPLRQVYSGMLLAAWFKRTLKQSLLAQIYANKGKVAGLVSSPNALPSAGVGDPEHIYQKYLQAYKKGVFNFIKEDSDTFTNEKTSRKYFSGGMESYAMTAAFTGKEVVRITHDSAMGSAAESKDLPKMDVVQIGLNKATNAAMLSRGLVGLLAAFIIIVGLDNYFSDDYLNDVLNGSAKNLERVTSTTGSTLLYLVDKAGEYAKDQKNAEKLEKSNTIVRFLGGSSLNNNDITLLEEIILHRKPLFPQGRSFWPIQRGVETRRIALRVLELQTDRGYYPRSKYEQLRRKFQSDLDSAMRAGGPEALDSAMSSFNKIAPQDRSRIEGKKAHLLHAARQLEDDLPQGWQKYWMNATHVPVAETVRDTEDELYGRITSTPQVDYYINQLSSRALILDFMAKAVGQGVSRKDYEDFLIAVHRLQMIGSDGETYYWGSGMGAIYGHSEETNALQKAKVLRGMYDLQKEFLEENFDTSFQRLKAFIDLKPGASRQEIIDSVASYYHTTMDNLPFYGGVNNSVVMNIVNAMLRLKGLQGISHGWLDYNKPSPRRLQLFVAAVNAMNPQPKDMAMNSDQSLLSWFMENKNLPLQAFRWQATENDFALRRVTNEFMGQHMIGTYNRDQVRHWLEGKVSLLEVIANNPDLENIFIAEPDVAYFNAAWLAARFNMPLQDARQFMMGRDFFSQTYHREGFNLENARKVANILAQKFDVERELFDDLEYNYANDREIPIKVIKDAANKVMELKKGMPDAAMVHHGGTRRLVGQTVFKAKATDNREVINNEAVVFEKERGLDSKIVVAFLSGEISIQRARSSLQGTKYPGTTQEISANNLNKLLLGAWNNAYFDGAKSAVANAPMTGKNAAMKADMAMTRGGIDLNSANLNLHIKRDGNGMPLPLAQQDLAQLANIQGLDPVILSITPASQTLLFAELSPR